MPESVEGETGSLAGVVVDRQLGQVLWKYVRGEGGEGLSAAAHIPHPSAQALVHPARPTTNVVPEPVTSHVSHIAPHSAPPTIPPSMNMKLKVAPILMVPYEGEPSLYCCTTRLCRTDSTLRFIELVRAWYSKGNLRRQSQADGQGRPCSACVATGTFLHHRLLTDLHIGPTDTLQSSIMKGVSVARRTLHCHLPLH